MLLITEDFEGLPRSAWNMALIREVNFTCGSNSEVMGNFVLHSFEQL